MSKKILGLDLGTTSIGWALIEQDFDNKQGKILGMGSRIIPMGQDILSDFGKGNSFSATKERTGFRGVRRIRERHLLRRQRLHRVLNILGFLPQHYSDQIDFKFRFGQFINDSEPKMAYNSKGFIFQKSFSEMLDDFKKLQPVLLSRKNRKGEDIKIPHDWTIYYLRNKALSYKIEKEELAWIILNFNQKRGYYQLRGEDEEEVNNKEFIHLKVSHLVDSGEKVQGNILYKVIFENGWEYDKMIVKKEHWEGKSKEFIVTIQKTKSGEIKRTFKAVDSEVDWLAIKTKTQQDISYSNSTVGTYIYKNLLTNPDQKINGKLVRTIERKFYKDELKAILEKQIELQPDLFTDDLYINCIRDLYKSNDVHQLQLSKRDFVHLFINDIIFYQRPLKSQKSSIGNCSLEFRLIKDKDGNEKKQFLKAISKSNPYYQEFRVWQWLFNLKIFTKKNDLDVTHEFIKNNNDVQNLFTFLMTRKEVDHKEVLKHFLALQGLKGKILNNEAAQYRWNYVYDSETGESKSYPMNETGYEIRKRIEKVNNLTENFLTPEIEYHLWHIIYSVKDKIEFEKALETFANKYYIDKDSFVEHFKNFKPFPNEYGRYSEKAIKRLLPLMRVGQYWNWDHIDHNTKDKISKLQNAEFDPKIRERVREKVGKEKLVTNEDFQGLQLWLAQYVVYDRHSEADSTGKWNSVEDLEKYLREFKQHSLRNPIVEKVIAETLRVVKDIWQQYGNGAKDYFSEIHIELGREMKNPADERKRLTKLILDNENTNLRIKAILIELLNDSSVENLRPYSPIHQEAFKIYEDGILNSGIEIPEDVQLILKKFNEIDIKKQPSKSDINRYKLWLEQKYQSPYTGQIIPLNLLFTTEYEIEHIIPQSRFFDDSLSNKVICESAVNKLKDNQLGLEFIKNQEGRIMDELSKNGNVVKIFNEEAYRKFIEEHYSKNRSKKSKLLLEEIPDKMIERQMNDTRYISKFISNVLSNIVRIDEDAAKKILGEAEILAKQSDETKAEEIRVKAKSEANDDGVNSKNVLSGNGKVTSWLKQDWGLNDVWNALILPRFERLNELTKSDSFTTKNKEGHIIPNIPLEYAKGFQKKRIDHRHHALDALVIACATRDHINLLNNQSAKSEKSRYDLQHKLRNTEKWIDNTGKMRMKFTEFKMPWKNFTIETKDALNNIVVSFKQNLRVINKATNMYVKYENGKKVQKKQEGTNWAIRKPMHKDTISGYVNLPWIKVPKDKILTASRKNLDTSFNMNNIEYITDTGIQKILKSYLLAKGGNPELAFSPEGIEDMNQNIAQYNGGKPHQPIFKVRVYELGSKFKIGTTGNKKSKYVEAAKGTNLFFAIYWNETKQKRIYETIPLHIVIERQKQGLLSVPEMDKNGNNLLFFLSPNDLVYVPTEHEDINNLNINNLDYSQVQRIYKMVSSTGNECHFIHSNIASLIINYDAKTKIGEMGSLNKLEITVDKYNPSRIKEVCIKLNIDRLGNISLPNKQKDSPNFQKEFEEGDSIVSEPMVIYPSKPKISFYENFEDMEKSKVQYFLQTDVYKRMKDAVELIKRAYGVEKCILGYSPKKLYFE